MSTQTGTVQFTRLRFTSKAAVSVVILIGGLTLTGWMLDLPLLESLLHGLAPMNPVTAVTFILSGAAFWLVAENAPPGRMLRPAGHVLALLVALIGGLGGYLSGSDLGIVLWMFKEKLGLPGSMLSRMAPNTALNFVLLGVALMLLDLKIGRGGWLAEYLTLAAALNAMLALLGQLPTAFLPSISSSPIRRCLSTRRCPFSSSAPAFFYAARTGG